MRELTKIFFDKIKETKQNEDYQKYIENGDSAVIFITKRFVNLDTRRKWIDVLSSYGARKVGNFWYFNKFQIEIFQRKQYPDYSSVKRKYSQDISDEMRGYGSNYNLEKEIQMAIDYITWETATKDIQNQRKQGIRGKKYEIDIEVVKTNLNKNKFHAVKIAYNKKFEQCVPSAWFNEDCEWRYEEKPVKPKYAHRYKIKSVKFIE